MTESPSPLHDSDGNANRAKTNELILAFKGFPHKNLRSGNETPVAAMMADKTCGNQTGTTRQRRPVRRRTMAMASGWVVFARSGAKW
jgi:hypothetical protein